MNSRTKARLRALEVLFEADQRNEDALDVLIRRKAYIAAQIAPYSEAIVRGVREKQDEINEYLETYSQGWTLDRMPSVDLIILRMGAWELLFNDEIPDPVAISESTGLARVLSTDDSPKFVNGLLDRLREVKPTLLA